MMSLKRLGKWFFVLLWNMQMANRALDVKAINTNCPRGRIYGYMYDVCSQPIREFNSFLPISNLTVFAYMIIFMYSLAYMS